MEINHWTRRGIEEQFAIVLKLTFDTNTIYTVIYWVKILFSLCLQRDILIRVLMRPRLSLNQFVCLSIHPLVRLLGDTYLNPHHPMDFQLP